MRTDALAGVQSDGIFKFECSRLMAVFLLETQSRNMLLHENFLLHYLTLLSNATYLEKMFAKNKIEMFQETQIFEPFAS